MEAVLSDHLSHPEYYSENVPQHSCMGLSYKANGLVRVAGPAVVTPLRIGLGFGLRLGCGLRLRLESGLALG